MQFKRTGSLVARRVTVVGEHGFDEFRQRRAGGESHCSLLDSVASTGRGSGNRLNRVDDGLVSL